MRIKNLNGRKVTVHYNADMDETFIHNAAGKPFNGGQYFNAWAAAFEHAPSTKSIDTDCIVFIGDFESDSFHSFNGVPFK